MEIILFNKNFNNYIFTQKLVITTQVTQLIDDNIKFPLKRQQG